MSELIRRQDAELILAREMYATSLEGGCDPVSPVDFLPEAKAWLSDAPTIRGWISVTERLPSAEPKTDDENELKFYYVESLDDYWVGRRLDNFYYATWHGRFGFIWSHSKYLPWGEHIVDENTLWKEHTYPSEPIEIPFTEWIVGFVKKYYAEPKTGGWIPCSERLPEEEGWYLVTIQNDKTRKRRTENDLFAIGIAEAHKNTPYKFCKDGHRQTVIAWMPLPEPYEAS